MVRPLKAVNKLHELMGRLLLATSEDNRLNKCQAVIGCASQISVILISAGVESGLSPVTLKGGS